MFRKIFCVILFCLVMLMSGCAENNTSTPTQEDSSKLNIAVSIPPEETFVKAVCKDMADVVTLIPPGNSPENYEPTPKQLSSLEDAKIYFSIGVPTEKAFIISKIPKDTKIIKLDDEAAAVCGDLKIGNTRDPHIWLSPKRAIVMVETIARELSEIDPQNNDKYLANCAEYSKQLLALDEEIKEAVSSMQSKKIIVYHPAFAYLCDDYGIKMYALEEEGKESTPRHLEEMIDIAKQENIKAVFYQEETDSSQAQSFAEQIGGKCVMLSPLSADYIENYKNMIELIKEASAL